MLRRDAIRLTALGLTALAPVGPLQAVPARAAFVDAPDVVLFCDPALREPLRRVGAAFRAATRVPVRIICAAGPIMAAQLARHERDDIIISRQEIIEGLAAAGLAHPQSYTGRWRNRLVVARRGPGAASIGPDRLPALLGRGMLGAPDPSVNAVVDTPALLRRLGLDQALAGRITGEIDTGGVAWLLARGEVTLGLILLTDATGDAPGDATGPGFSAAVSIPDDAYPAIRYEAAFAKHVLSRNGDGFMRFLATDQARASLTASGLDIES